MQQQTTQTGKVNWILFSHPKKCAAESAATRKNKNNPPYACNKKGPCLHTSSLFWRDAHKCLTHVIRRERVQLGEERPTHKARRCVCDPVLSLFPKRFKVSREHCQNRIFSQKKRSATCAQRIQYAFRKIKKKRKSCRVWNGIVIKNCRHCCLARPLSFSFSNELVVVAVASSTSSESLFQFGGSRKNSLFFF